jgi:hypothetical protein
VCWLLVTASVLPSSPILVTLMKEALSSSEMSVLTRATRHNIPEDTILHTHCHENLKSYIRKPSFIIASLEFLQYVLPLSQNYLNMCCCMFAVCFLQSIDKDDLCVSDMFQVPSASEVHQELHNSEVPQNSCFTYPFYI